MIFPITSDEFLQASGQTTRGTLRVAETFISRQGEGKLTGADSFFIRTSGCNLRCWFCDTPYASWQPTGTAWSIDSIVNAVVESDQPHVVLTGGEPLLPKESVELCRVLRQQGYHVTIETAGTIDRKIECDLMSISPKFFSSAPAAEEHPNWNRRHHRRRQSVETIAALIDRAADFQLKFVCDSAADYDELVEMVDRLGVESSNVWVMPQGSTIDAINAAINWLKPWCEQQGFRYCDRHQIRWYGNRRGT